MLHRAGLPPGTLTAPSSGHRLVLGEHKTERRTLEECMVDINVSGLIVIWSYKCVQTVVCSSDGGLSVILHVSPPTKPLLSQQGAHAAPVQAFFL